MNELIDLRRQLLSGHLTQDQVREVKRHITVRLDWGKSELLSFTSQKMPEQIQMKNLSLKCC